MKRSKLPKSINPVQLAAQNEHIQGQLSLQQCERLASLLRENTGSVDFSLQFMQDESVRSIVRVKLNAELKVECGRCLQPMPYPIAYAVDLAVVADNQAAVELPDCYEPLLVTDDEVVLESLIEDELLLSLPVMPSHSEGECSVAVPTNWVNNELDEHKNPFAVLKKLSDTR